MAVSGEQLVDAIEAVTGTHAGRRRAHAKGMVVTGTFTGSPEGAALSRAPQLQGQPVDATVRFSNGSGVPTNRDDEQDGRGIAVKLAGDPAWDLIGLTLPQFFVRTPEAFMEFMAARADMDKMGDFIAGHPEALPAIEAALTAPVPASYAQLGYQGIHTFFYEDGDGSRRPVRHEWVPEAGDAVLEGDDPDRVADHLQDECRGRLGDGAIVFTLRLHLGTDEDDSDDPTVRWPDERDTVDAGRLEITAVADDQDAADRAIFDPTNVPDGVVCSNDLILHARSAAYGVSYERRLAGQ